jgi:hypothetical protein
VFMAGVALAHAIKASILARAQQQMLAVSDDTRRNGHKMDPVVRAQLVESRSSPVALLLTAAIFLTLGVAGVLVRTQGSATDGQSMAVVLFQALIPLVAVAVELYLHDPTERDEPAPNSVDRRLERKLAKAERRLRIVAAQVEAKVAQIEKLYRVEEAILEVEQRDMGMRRSEDYLLGTADVSALAAASNGHAGALGTGSLAVGALGPGSLAGSSLGGQQRRRDNNVLPAAGVPAGSAAAGIPEAREAPVPTSLGANGSLAANGRAGDRDRDTIERTLKMARRP